jgi:hypothetical protein
MVRIKLLQSIDYPLQYTKCFGNFCQVLGVTKLHSNNSNENRLMLNWVFTVTLKRTVSIRILWCIYEVVSKTFWTDPVKIIKLTIRHIGHHNPQNSSLPHVDTGPTVSSIFGMLPGSPFLSDCQALSAIRPGSPLVSNWHPFGFNFILGNRSYRVPNHQWLPWTRRFHCWSWADEVHCRRRCAASLQQVTYTTPNERVWKLPRSYHLSVLCTSTAAVYMAAPVHNILDTVLYFTCLPILACPFTQFIGGSEVVQLP